MRTLKHHEQKLLKKVNFLNWTSDGNIREVKILRKYRIQKREDYTKYNRICGIVTSLVAKLRNLKSDDDHRVEVTQQVLDKLYSMGLITTKKSLLACEKLAASSFCRRRLPVVLVRNKFAENLKEATTFIEQGHIRVGPETVCDPAFLVTRSMEDHITWVDSSKIKQKVDKYNNRLDDYDLVQFQ